MKHLAYIVLLFLPFVAVGQIEEPGFPLSTESFKSSSMITTIPMPEFKMDEVVEYELKNSTDKSYIFAYPFEVDIDVKKKGDFYKLGNMQVWKLAITSPGAHSLNVIFSQYQLPEGARLFLYSSDQSQILGAFTNRNNKKHGQLAVFPISDDALIVQYEEPNDAEFEGKLIVGQVAHDFKGVFSNPQRRRPKNVLAQWCNVNANCEGGDPVELQKRAVCRMLAHGTELCSGTLVNNVTEDKTPYLITAKHCIENDSEASTSIFDFNYESPICSDIDGDDIQTLSGSSLIAALDSMDMVMVRLSEMPPESYRPYLAGWSLEEKPENPIYTLHHPMGDTKKVTREDHDLLYATYISGGREFITNGHWRVPHWEMGTTEVGSSGAGLFTTNGHFIGTLSGGQARCGYNVNDYYGRFNVMWDYRSKSNEQFKYWLDPLNEGVERIDGIDPYADTDFSCTAIINFNDNDTVAWYRTVRGNPNSIGYLSGSNNIGISEVCEHFIQTDSCELAGISLGVARNYSPSNSKINIKIYEGDTHPQYLKYKGQYPIGSLDDESVGIQGVMNYLKFSEPLSLIGDFFISIELPESPDTVALMQTEWRVNEGNNTFLVKQNGEWKQASELVNTNFTSSLLIQAIVCNAVFAQNDTIISHEYEGLKIYPNPSNGYLFIDSFEGGGKGTLKIYNIAGQLCYTDEIYGYEEVDESQFYDVRFLLPGVYIVLIELEEETYTSRFIKSN